MAQTRPYSELLTDIQSKMGVHNGFSTNELTSIKSEVNSRIHELYLESDFWENILVIGEERAVNTDTNVVPYTGAIVDDGVATPYAGSVDTFLRIHKKKPWDDKDALEYEFAGVGEGARIVGYTDRFGLSKTVDTTTASAGTVTVSMSGDLVDYYVGGKVQLTNFATTPADINGIQTITAVGSASYVAGNTRIQFTLDGASGTWTLTGDETAEAPVAYCTYKKRISGTTYGDGSGETSDIPFEWFRAIACGVAATLYGGDGNGQMSAFYEAKFQREVDLQIERLDAMHAAQTVGSVFHTHLSEQGRAINF